MDKRLSVDADRRTRLEQRAHAASLLVEAVAAGKAEEAGAIAVSNIYRYYAGDLDAAEKSALAAFVDMPHDAR